MSFTTTASRRLRSSLLRARSTAPSPCSAANPTSTCAGPPALAQRGEHVAGRLELEREPLAPGLRDLRLLRRGGPEVGHRRRHQEHVGRVELGERGPLELGGALDVDVADAGLARERHVRRHDRHLRPAPGRLGGQCEAHPARGAVADEANRVDRLARAAGADEHAHAGRGSLPAAPASSASIAARICGGSASLPSPHSPFDASSPVAGATMLAPRRRSVSTFDWVALWRHIRSFIAGATSSGAGRGQRGAGQQVVGQAVSELGDRVGRGGDDREDVGARHQLEVRDRVVVGSRVAGEGAAGGIALELLDEHGRAGDSLERRPADELEARRRLDDADRVAGLDRKPGRARPPCMRRCRP